MELELRDKNQMTLPDKVARRLGIGRGTRLVLLLDEAAGEIRLRPLRESYAGALAGVYGRVGEIDGHLDEERRGWGQESSGTRESG